MKKLKDTLLFVTSIFATIILCEIVIRIFFPIETGDTWRTPEPNGSLFFVNIPDKKTTHKFGSYSTVYQINHLGQRGPASDEKEKNITFVGDSFVFGLFVDEVKSFVGKIREFVSKDIEFNQIGVINGAVAGSGLAEWIAHLNDYGDKFNSKLIVYGLNYPSISRGYSHPLYKLNCEEGILERTKNTDKVRNAFNYIRRMPLQRWLVENSQLFMVFRKGVSSIIIISSNFFASKGEANGEDKLSSVFWPDPDHSYDNLDKEKIKCFVKLSFRDLSRSAEKHGARLAVIDLGYRWQSNVKEDSSLDLIGLKMTPEILSDLKIPFLDLTEEMLKAKKNGSLIEIPNDGHPSEEGYNIMAKAMWPFIRNELAKINWD